MALPVRWHAAGGTGGGLTERVMQRRRQLGPFVVLVVLVVPEPVLTRLVAPDDRVTTVLGVRAGVLPGRAVAAPDVPAFRTPAEVEAPSVGGVALDAAGSAGLHLRVDRFVGHW